jgi:hypothetical protein
MDCKLMEELFSNEDGFANFDHYTTYVSEETQQEVADTLEHMSRISPIEADMVELHLLRGVSQALLGRIFGYTQPNIHYRINRGIQRLRVYLTINRYTEEELRSRLGGFFTDQKDIDVMVFLYLYSSQSYVARKLGDTQGKVRYRYLKCIKSLSSSANLQDIYESMKIIGENLTLLRIDPEDYREKRAIL